MHPIAVLFEDIYRNHWGIEPAARRPAARRKERPWRRGRDEGEGPVRRQD